uniref:Uncharacterized protein n=1 Tax=Vannella robusta TaxID=1487602 RepID=A0A7S4MPE0_9EUKA
MGACECLPKKTLSVDSIASSIEDTFVRGMHAKCPGCNASIQRSDACTYIQCNVRIEDKPCNTLFCYFCEKSIEFLPGSTWKSEHNENWKTRKDRCPLFLSSHPLLDNQPDEQQTAYFHYFKTLRLLKQLRTDFLQRNMESIPEGYCEAEWKSHLIEVWNDAMRKKQFIWQDSPFNYVEGLANYPDERSFQCALP